MAKKSKVVTIPNSWLFGDKMRIKLVDPQTGALISDRLVAQATEFRNGPTEIHKGPMCIEFNLNSQEDVDGMVTYIKKLKGELPIAKPEKKSSTNKTLEKMLRDKDAIGDLINTIKTKSKTQEDIIKNLREYNFMFIDQSIAIDGPSKEQLTLRQKDIDRDYQYMVRRIKEAKDPANDKFDWRLVFAIKIVGERLDLVQIYYWGSWKESFKIKWEEPKKMNFKKVEKIYSFPEMMDYVERKKWRMENRKVLKHEAENKEYSPSKFYTKWKPYVKVN